MGKFSCAFWPILAAVIVIAQCEIHNGAHRNLFNESFSLGGNVGPLGGKVSFEKFLNLPFGFLGAGGAGFSSTTSPSVSSTTHQTSEEPVCTLRRQSPINLDFQVVLAKFQDLVWSTKYNELPQSIVALNNGDTIQLTSQFFDGSKPILSGGPLYHKYRLEQVHFHWGNVNQVGSEHTFFGSSFPMEIHAVHVRDDLTNDEAKNYFDGYAVVAYFVVITLQENEIMEEIIETISELKIGCQANLCNVFSWNMLVYPFTQHYYTYGGSLTNYPYSEAAIWLISTQGVTVSQRQLNMFRSISMENPHLENNYNTVQPRNGRIVYFSSDI